MRLLSLVGFAFPVLAALAGQTIADDAANEGRVYSEAQAVRGEELYQQYCSLCHGARLQGNPAAPLTGDAFRGRWEDGKHTLDEMLSERERLNLDLQKILDSQTDAWGIKVTNVEIKHVDLNESMIRAIARQAEAERERRAKVIHAEGELQAAEKLAQAAEILAKQPQAIQLRYLETLTVIAADKNSTIVFPLPMDIVAPLIDAMKRSALPSV
jgi:mono/diheme cytochrome c family protein